MVTVSANGKAIYSVAGGPGLISQNEGGPGLASETWVSAAPIRRSHSLTRQTSHQAANSLGLTQ
jgi:hypothetical protein